MFRSRSLKVAVAAACLVPFWASAPAVAADPFADYANQKLDWGACLFKPLADARPAQCALVTVPRDWARPEAGQDLKVSISRVAATGERSGVLLVNPGGPGGQGTSLAGSIAGVQPALNQQYDVIGMDPRGTGQEGGTTDAQRGLVCSVPVNRLPKAIDLDARDRSAHSIAEHQKTPRGIAEACQTDALTPYITTWQTAHDMELVRKLLGEKKLNYVGYSYGTWLGAKYASMFPSSAGKMVLDSSVNWQGRLQADFEDFPRMQQRAFDQIYLPWLARQFPESVGDTPAQAKRTWEAVREFFKTHPENQVSADGFDAVFVAGNGSEFGWVLSSVVLLFGVELMSGTDDPALNLSQQQQGRFDAVARAAFGVPVAKLTPKDVVEAVAADYTDFNGTRFAVACGDQPTRSAAWYRRLSDRQGPALPLYGWAYGVSEPCGFWSDPPQQVLATLPAEVADQVLVVQGEFDPQTAYEQARAAVRAAPGVSLLSVDDTVYHGVYALGGNPCVDGMVNTFLLKNSRPAKATCPGVPLVGETEVYPVGGPVPSASALATKAARGLPDSPLRELTQNLVSRVNTPARG